MAHQAIRSFLAIELSEAMKGEVQRFIKKIEHQFPGFRFGNPETWHLTLHFLGAIGSEKLESLSLKIPKALEGTKPFQLFLEGVGVFPNTK